MHQRDYHLVVLGSGGVGKSCLTAQFVNNVWIESYDPTIEDSYRKQFEVDGRHVMLEILDTAGTEQFTAMRELYMKSGQGFLLVFSLIDAPSLRELGEIRDQLIRITDDPKVPLVLVGNKSDLSHMITVDNNRIKQASQGWGGIPYYETSARRRVNVDDAFRDLVRQIMIKERQAEKAMAAQGGTGGNGGYDGNAGQPQQIEGYRQYDDETPREQPKRWRRRRPKCVIL